MGIKFGELTQTEQIQFEELVKKSHTQEHTSEQSELWPDDDEETVQNYFKK